MKEQNDWYLLAQNIFNGGKNDKSEIIIKSIQFRYKREGKKWIISIRQFQVDPMVEL